MSEFSKELLDVVDERKKESNDHLRKSGEILINMFNGGEPKNINPLTEIPEPQMRLYGYSSFFGRSAYFDTEAELIEYLKNNKCDMSFGGVCIIEYMGTMAGRSDVVRRTYQGSKPSLVTVATEDHIGTYNERRSCHQGQFVWEGNPGDLREEYSAFKERGIVLENDIYARHDERMESLMRIMDEHSLFNRGGKSSETETVAPKLVKVNKGTQSNPK